MALGATHAAGQYSHLREPLTTGEIRQIKGLNIMGEKQYLMNGTEKQLHAIKLYTREGFLYANMDYNNRTYYKYDEKGRMVVMLDSVRASDGFKPEEYHFIHDPVHGKLVYVKFPSDQGSSFTYNRTNRTLTEVAEMGGMTLKNYYTYNEYGFLTSEKHVFPSGLVQRSRELVYDTLERVIGETEVIAYPMGQHDSAIYKYTYDSAGRLTTVLIQTMHLKEGEEPGMAFDMESKDPKKLTVETYTYTYDARGNRTSEHYRSTKPEADYVRQWEYNERGEKIEETELDAAMVPVRAYVFEYIYWE